MERVQALAMALSLSSSQKLVQINTPLTASSVSLNVSGSNVTFSALSARSAEWVSWSGRGGEAVGAVGVGREVARVRRRDEVDVGEVWKRDQLFFTTNDVYFCLSRSIR